MRIHYELEGEGRSLVLIPPPFGDLNFFRISGHVNALRARCQVIRVDPRGHGGSDRPTDRSAHSIDAYREDLRAVLDAAGADKVVLAGPYGGVYAGWEFAQAYPDRVSALIDFDAFEVPDLCEHPDRDSDLEFARNLRVRGRQVLREHVESYGVSTDTPIAQNIIASDPESVASEMETWANWHGPVSLLPRLSIPILLLRNGDTKREYLDRIRETVGSRGELHVVSGVGHWRMVTEVEPTLPLVRTFLSRTDM